MDNFKDLGKGLALVAIVLVLIGAGIGFVIGG